MRNLMNTVPTFGKELCEELQNGMYDVSAATHVERCNRIKTYVHGCVRHVVGEGDYARRDGNSGSASYGGDLGWFGLVWDRRWYGGRASEIARYDIVRADDGASALRCTLETRVWESGPVDLFPTTPTSSPNVVDVFRANTRALMALS